MKPDLSSIQNPQVRTFYALYWPMHQIVVDFFSRVSEEQFDFRMVDTPERKADSPRESLAHIIYVEMIYFDCAKNGKLAFRSLGTEHYVTLSKERLLSELERVDSEMYALLTAAGFESRQVEVFWGGTMNVIDVLFFLRDHDILHTGWNLAYMDHFNLPRFDSLIRYWG